MAEQSLTSKTPDSTPSPIKAAARALVSKKAAYYDGARLHLAWLLSAQTAETKECQVNNFCFMPASGIRRGHTATLPR